MKNITDIPVQNTLLLLLIGSVLALSFYVVRNYIIPLIRNNKKGVKKFWQKVEIISWLVFAVVVLIVLLRVNLFLSSAILVLLLMLGWGYWKNIFSGLVIKLTDELVVDEVISGDFGEGKIKSIRLSVTELSNDKGELMSIPNGVLRSSVVKHLHKKSSLKTNTFSIPMFENESLLNIKELMINCPFVAANQNIIVERVSDNECAVKATLIDSSFKENVYLYIQNRNN